MKVARTVLKEVYLST